MILAILLRIPVSSSILFSFKKLLMYTYMGSPHSLPYLRFRGKCLK